MVLQSNDKDDCKHRMHEEVNKLVLEFVKKDDFVHDIPIEDIDILKKKLELGFEQEYQDKYNEKKGEIIKVLEEALNKVKITFILLFIVFILICLFKSHI